MFSFSLIGILIYFLPTFIAAHRGHRVPGIFLLNLFFGWTGIGWLVMLLWALFVGAPGIIMWFRLIPLMRGEWRRY